MGSRSHDPDAVEAPELHPDEEGNVTTAQAAAYLDTSAQNVVGRFHSGAIAGHQRPPRKGGTIYLEGDAVRAYKNKKGRRRGPAPTRHDAQLAEALSRIETRLRALEDAVSEAARRTATDAQTAAVLALLGVNDELRSAAAASDETSEHMARAVLSALESKRAQNRADQLRDEVLRQFSIPDYPPAP